MTANVIPLHRRATARDYRWQFDLQAYVLRFEPHLRPGVMTNDPAQGALEYNRYLDTAPEIRAGQDASIGRLRELLAQLRAGSLPEAFADLLRVVVLHFYEPQRHRFFNREEMRLAANLSATEREALYLAFWYSGALQHLLSPADAARLALTAAR